MANNISKDSAKRDNDPVSESKGKLVFERDSALIASPHLQRPYERVNRQAQQRPRTSTAILMMHTPPPTLP